MFWIAFAVFALGTVAFALEYNRNKIWRAIAAAISTVAAVIAIASAVNSFAADNDYPPRGTEPPGTTDQEGVSESIGENTGEGITYYRYREREYTTSASPNLDGWELYDKIEGGSDFGEWSSWQYEYVEPTDLREVETTTHYRSREVTEAVEYGPWSEWSTEPRSVVGTNTIEESDTVLWYGYYYFECPNCHAHMHGWDIICPTWAGGCGQAYIPEGSWHQLHSETSWDDANLRDWHGTGKYYTYINGELYFKWDYCGEQKQYRYRDYWINRYVTEWSPYTETVILSSDNTEVETATAYRYRERSETTVYMFRRWGEWSDWSDSKREPSETVQVESVVR